MHATLISANISYMKPFLTRISKLKPVPVPWPAGSHSVLSYYKQSILVKLV